MEKTAESLVMVYLAANLDFKDIPLKRLLDDCEKKILLESLHLTRGSQKNAAALLGLKATALFEKMRKHGINARQIKMSEKLEALPAKEND
jgi:DNA-binding NtrC family response regulator